MHLRLLEKLRSHARRQPHSVAVRQIIPSNGRVTTYAELSAQVDSLARRFAISLPPRSTVMICSGNRVEYIAAFLAALVAEMSVFPLAPDIAGPELLSAAQRSGAAAIIGIGQPTPPVEGRFRDNVPVTECSADATLHTNPTWPANHDREPSLLLLSSGTTGRPKIVRRDGPSLDAVSENMVNAIGFTPADRVLAAVPLCHSYGMEHGLLCPIWAGACTHLYNRFDLPAAIADLTGDAETAVTVFPGVPFMFESLCGAGEISGRFPALRRAYSAGGPLPRTLFDAFLKQFSVRISQLYGATEIGSVTFNDPSLENFDPASVGRPMNGVSIQILDPDSNSLSPAYKGEGTRPKSLPAGIEGHVAIKAPSMLSEYIDDPFSLDHGYFLTGDLGRLDSSGALTITGRIKLLVDIAGRKVNPLEVEEVLCSHPSVAECVVVPLRISDTLCRLRAVIVVVEPSTSLDLRELRQFARSRLSAYKVPRVFQVRETLPRSATGKVLRNVLENEGVILT